MAKKLYDIAVANGKYTDKEGNEKNSYKNIGVILEGDNGPYMLLERSVNLAGFAVNDKSPNTVLASMFSGTPSAQGNQNTTASNMKDDIPF
jgi:hypothetical protein